VLNDIEHQTTRDVSVAQAHHGLGEIFHHLKRYELAREHLEDAIEVARGCHNTEVEQHALIVLGEVNLAETGTVSSSYMATFEERLERLSDDRPLLKARGLQHLGRMALAASDAQVAERFFARAHMIAEELSDTNLKSSVSCDLGHALLLQRRTAEGEGKLREALAAYRESSNRLGIAVTLFRLGLAAWQRGDAREALETLRQALAIRRRLPAARYLVETLALVGRVHESEGRLPEACDSYEGALKRANAPHERAGILMRLGPTLLKMRELDRAREALRRASEDLDPLRFGTELVECINLQAMAAAWSGDNAAALAFLDRSADLAESLENGPGLVFSMVATALVRWRAGEEGQGENVQKAREAAENLDAKGIMPLVEVAERLFGGEGVQPFPEGLPSLHRAWLTDLTAIRPEPTES
jgi:tetratricopeptide (TPR) repeat protein